jgi:hypothetical protein
MVETDITLHIGEIAFSYYQVRRSSPNEQDFEQWLESLQEPAQSIHRGRGLRAALKTQDFLRFFAEIRDKEMIAYMQERLSEKNFLYWLAERHRPA